MEMIAIIVKIVITIKVKCTSIVENIAIIIMDLGATIEKTITTVFEKYPKVSIIVGKVPQIW